MKPVLRWSRRSLPPAGAWALLATTAAVVVPQEVWADPVKVQEILQKSGKTGVAQNTGLNPDAKKQIEQAADQAAQKTGAKAYVVVLKSDLDPQVYGDLYGKMGLSGKDILLATNGTKWDLRAASLSDDARVGILSKTAQGSGNPVERVGKVLSETATALNEARAGTAIATVGAKEVPLVRKESSNTGLYVFLVLAALAAGAFVFFRRKKRDAALAVELKQALAAPEGVLTDIYMNMDSLENHPNFGDLLDQANRVQAKLDEIKNGTPSRESISRLRSIHEEANRVRRAFDDAKLLR